MRLSKPPIQKDPQLIRFYLSIAAVAVALPLALNSKIPTETPSPDSSAVQLASRTVAPQTSTTTKWSRLPTHGNASVDDNTLQAKLDTGNAMPGGHGKPLPDQQKAPVAGFPLPTSSDYSSQSMGQR